MLLCLNSKQTRLCSYLCFTQARQYVDVLWGVHLSLNVAVTFLCSQSTKIFWLWINNEFSAFSPQTAIRLLSHKIQSPQEKEALQALTVRIWLFSMFISKRLREEKINVVFNWLTAYLQEEPRPPLFWMWTLIGLMVIIHINARSVLSLQNLNRKSKKQKNE